MDRTRRAPSLPRRTVTHPAPAGTRNADAQPWGFTLLELMVVLLLISLLLGFAIPRIQPGPSSASIESLARWLTAKVPALKNRAREEQRGYGLAVDLDRNRIWVRPAADRDNGISAAPRDSLQLPPGVQLLDVVRPGRPPQDTGVAVIGFYPRGHSDKAVIHCRENGRHLAAFLIEPFLPGIERYARYQTL